MITLPPQGPYQAPAKWFCKIDFAKLQVFENKSVFESVKNAVQNG